MAESSDKRLSPLVPSHGLDLQLNYCMVSLKKTTTREVYLIGHTLSKEH